MRLARDWFCRVVWGGTTHYTLPHDHGQDVQVVLERMPAAQRPHRGQPRRKGYPLHPFRRAQG